MLQKTVQLYDVPKDVAQENVDRLAEICDQYGIEETDRDEIWHIFAVFCTYCFLEYGCLPDELWEQRN